MENRRPLTARERRALLRGGVVAGVSTALSQTQSAEAQSKCNSGIELADIATGEWELGSIKNPRQEPGVRHSISEKVKGNGLSPVRIPLNGKEEITFVNGQRAVTDVAIFDDFAARYVRDKNGDIQRFTIVCDRPFLRVALNRRLAVTPSSNGGGLVTPETATSSPAERVVTATPTPTARVETATPTVTPVIHTPTSTATPFVVTATPTPETPIPIVVTATPTETLTATATSALPTTFRRDLDFWEGLWCVGPLAVVGLGATLMWAATRDHR